MTERCRSEDNEGPGASPPIFFWEMGYCRNEAFVPKNTCGVCRDSLAEENYNLFLSYSSASKRVCTLESRG